MTWNLRGWARPDLTEVATVIASYEADVVAVQEVQRWQARRLARSLRYHYKWARKHFPYGLFLWWRAEGLAVFSPHPLEGRHRYVLSPGIHPWTYRRRIALRVKVRIPGLTLRIFDVHLASNGAAKDRIDQATILAGVLAEERQRAAAQGEPFRAVVVGDLNANGEPDVLAPLHAAGFKDAWSCAEGRSAGDGLTCPTDRPSGRIDYVLIEVDDHSLSALVPEPSQTWRALSDHLPVVVTVGMT